MSEVKRHSVSGYGRQDICYNDPEGEFVYYEDYAELKAQSDALAAECATLKDINAWCQTEAFQNMYREFKTAEAIGCPDVDCMHDAMLTALMHAPKTPATDAYLNSVRNELVDEAIHALAASGAQSFGDCMVALNQLRAGEPS
jgi:hypothetical protein